ncbi:TIM barrel protein [Roseiarcaceae bacterium H3SJ34-1]|uniref:bifunctional sugar phosphate isomerase/epimerase/4-hydroxyphenylpyruvate dioxygenase family protein n=1 Tax=Terripilifer ovatus TaxID=3032367 RepID=UPI003AB9A539|nr:TIM barrel protein [Roseiarcaceae bacterium H3SJ34-1]
MLRWSIATVSMGGTLEVKLAAAARAGFRAIEIFENDLTFFNGRPRDVRARAEDLGLEIVALQPMRDFEGMPEPMRSRNFERAQRKFDLMEELGTGLLCVCSNVHEESLGEPERAARDLADLADLAARRGFSIGYEAMAWGRHVKDWMQADDIVMRAARPNLGLVLDSYHICVRNNPLAPIADIPAGRIALVQLADAPAILMDPMSLSRHHRCFPGQGDYPIGDFLDAITKSGYRGPLSLEIFNDQFRGAPAATVARDGMRALQVAGETLDARRAGAGLPVLNIGPPLPPAATIRGIEFIEFATGAAESSRLVDWLGAMGFARVARHRTKDVELYRQNDLNIVVNREQDGFAHSFYLVHGTSVCALAMRFNEPRQALERANALGAQTYHGRVGPGEAIIPAVAGVENSLIYFMGEARKDGSAPSNWDQDFIFSDEKQHAGPLERIDHLSNVVRRSEFLSWITFYKSILGFVDEPQVELADPYGAFYSRVIGSPDKSVRIPMNIGDGGSTGVSRFIDTFGGGGVQQIAFSTQDLFGFVEKARAAGMSFLEIPDNYYEDLSARYDLSDELIERMRGLGVLYDRSKGGEFFHIYTHMFDERFFFEIVERRNYDLFGAANTPVRLAAQMSELDEAMKSRAMLSM